jgi:hypothetical protein
MVDIHDSTPLQTLCVHVHGKLWCSTMSLIKLHTRIPAPLINIYLDLCTTPLLQIRPHSSTTQVNHTSRPHKSNISNTNISRKMCYYEFWTASGCAHERYTAPNGAPIPRRETDFFAHGHWQIRSDRCERARRRRMHCEHPRRMTYQEMTADLNNPRYQLEDDIEDRWRIDPRSGDLVPDRRCSRCRARSNSRAR